MKKIIYFTTAIDKTDYKDYLEYWDVSPNLSNQNFHYKLIKAISITNEVNVISVRPINKNYQLDKLESGIKVEDNIIWNYVEVKNSRLDKLLSLDKRIKEVVNEERKNECVIIVDTMNRYLLKEAIKYAHRYKFKIYGVCTDNPINISFVSNGYKKDLLSMGKKLDGYIALTPKLNELFNINNKPYVLIDGITENFEPETNINIKFPYVFFGGSLLPRYGVDNLIEAFERLNKVNLKLVICGHHEPEGFKEKIKKYSDIIYLGPLTYDDVCAIQKEAECAVNPRPTDVLIDEYSIPSKTLEYLSNEVLTISVDNALLKKHYKDAIIWTKTGSADELYVALVRALSLSDKEKEKYISIGKELVEKYTSLDSVNKLIQELIL